MKRSAAALGALASLFLLVSCEQLSIKKTPEAPPKKAAASTDEPMVIADGSVRMLFRAPVYALDTITPVYGCCLASPAIGAAKEIRVYHPAGDGLPMQIAKKAALGAKDVVEVYLERKVEGGWKPYSDLKYPLPQLMLHRNDFRAVLENSKNPARSEFEKTDYLGWMLVTTSVRQDAGLTQDANFVRATGFKSEYSAFGSRVRLASLTIKRADAKTEMIPVASACTVIEFCTTGQCLASMPSPCH